MKRWQALVLIPIILIAAFLVTRMPGNGPGGVPRNPPASPPSAQMSIREILDNWTFPGVPAAAMSGSMDFREATREFDLKTPPGWVWGFYARKTGYSSPHPQFPAAMHWASSGLMGSGNIIVEEPQAQSQEAIFFMTNHQSVVSAVVTVFKTKGTCHVVLHVGTPGP